MKSASRRRETLHITFRSLLLAPPSLNSGSLQHIRGCDSESLRRSIQPDSSENKKDVLPLEAPGLRDAQTAQTLDRDTLTEVTRGGEADLLQ